MWCLNYTFKMFFMSKYVFQQLPPSNSVKRKIDIISYLGKLFFMVAVKDRNSRGFYGNLEFQFSLQVNQTY